MMMEPIEIRACRIVGDDVEVRDGYYVMEDMTLRQLAELMAGADPGPDWLEVPLGQFDEERR